MRIKLTFIMTLFSTTFLNKFTAKAQELGRLGISFTKSVELTEFGNIYYIKIG